MAENQNQQGSQSQQSGGSGRGFASMDEEKQRQAASKGGTSVPPQERSFSKDRELASDAGRRGGESSGGQQGGQHGGQQGGQHGGQQGGQHGGQQGGQHGGQGQEGARGGSGNVAQDREKASEAGRKGGQH